MVEPRWIFPVVSLSQMSLSISSSSSSVPKVNFRWGECFLTYTRSPIVKLLIFVISKVGDTLDHHSDGTDFKDNFVNDDDTESLTLSQNQTTVVVVVRVRGFDGLSTLQPGSPRHQPQVL